MSIAAVARRYAEALADLAVEHRQTAEIGAELDGYAQLFSHDELYNAFASPIVPQISKQRILDDLIARTKPGKTMENLLRLLFLHYRLHLIPAVRDQFHKAVNVRQGVIPAEVTTAAAVSDADKEALRSQLERTTGKRIDIKFKIDPALLGGAVTKLGSVVYDGSIRTRLRLIKEGLKQEVAGL